MKIGEQIKELVKIQGLTKEEFAVKMSMTVDNLYKIYSKEDLNTKILGKIADILGVPITYFLDAKEKNLNIGDNNTTVIGSKNKTTVSDTEVYKKEIEVLKNEIKLKDKIIQLLENK